MRRARSVKLAVQLIVLATTALMVFAATRVQWADVWSGLESSNVWWTLPSLGLFAAATAVRTIRWRSVISAERRPPFSPIGRALLIGYFFNNVLPARAGEPARIIALNRESELSPAEIAATVVVERVLDVACLLLLFALALPWLPSLGWNMAAAWILAGAVIALLVLLVLLALGEEPLLRRVLSPFTRLPGLRDEHVIGVAQSLSRGLSTLRTFRSVAIAVGWTLLSWLLLAASSWVLMLGFDFGLSPFAGLVVIVAAGLASILPALPAGIGIFEAATVLALDAYSVSHSQALSYAVVFHAINVVPFLAVGAPLVWRHADLWRTARWSGSSEQAPAD
jgi:uncharacterized protein (TIRG00374 family)